MKKDYKKFLLTMVDGKEFPSDKFHRLSSNKRLNVQAHKNMPMSWIEIHFKAYPRLSKIKLSNAPPKTKSKLTLIDLLRERRSAREFSGESISIGDLSYLLLCSGGLVDHNVRPDDSRRPYPSAGARYPLEVYPLIINGGEGLESGLYHYNVKEHCLETLLQDNLQSWLLEVTGKFKSIVKASVLFIITGVLDRSRVKYGERGYRYALIEAGHVAQNLLLLATELGMANLPMGGFIDSKVIELLDLKLVKEAPLYMIMVGKHVKT